MKLKQKILITIIPSIFICMIGILLYKSGHQSALKNSVSFQSSFYKKRGDEGILQKNYLNAIENYKQAIQKNYNYLPALIALGNILSETEDYTTSFYYLDRAYKIEPRNKEILAALIRLFLKKNDIEQANKYIKLGTKEHPYDAELNFLQAEWLLKQNNFYLAKKKYKEVLSWDPSYYQALLALSKIALKENNLLIAEQYLREAKNIAPNSPDIFITLAKTLLYKALAQQEELLYSEPLNIDIFQEALIELQNARNYDPQNIEVNLLSAKIFALTRRCDEAIPYLKDILIVAPSHFESSYLLGFCDPSKSIELYPNLLKISDDDDIINYQLESKLLKLSNSRVNPSLISLSKKHFFMSHQFLDLGEQGKSLYEIKWSLYLTPNLIKAHEELISYYRLQENFIELQHTLDLLRNNSTNNEKYQALYEQLIDARKQKLYYKENILNIEGIKTRTPLFIFYFKPENPFGFFPDAGEAIAEKLSFALSYKGRIQIVSKLERDTIYNLLQKQNYFGHGGYYNNKLIPLIKEEMDRYLIKEFEYNKEDNPVTIDPPDLQYIVAGTYTEILNGLKVTLKVIDIRHGLPIAEVKAYSQGRGYLTNISVYLANQLYEIIPLRGKILQVKSTGALINLGSRDGITKKTIFNIKSGTLNIKASPIEIDSDLSLISFKNVSSFYNIKTGSEVTIE